jgi:hypothetical protein
MSAQTNHPLDWNGEWNYKQELSTGDGKTNSTECASSQTWETIRMLLPTRRNTTTSIAYMNINNLLRERKRKQALARGQTSPCHPSTYVGSSSHLFTTLEVSFVGRRF